MWEKKRKKAWSSYLIRQWYANVCSCEEISEKIEPIRGGGNMRIWTSPPCKRKHADLPSPMFRERHRQLVVFLDFLFFLFSKENAAIPTQICETREGKIKGYHEYCAPPMSCFWWYMHIEARMSCISPTRGSPWSKSIGTYQVVLAFCSIIG